tara:strand:- start:2539 stop:3294 length:756 start_codon:yes stop_codon:yes gene_type:complete
MSILTKEEYPAIFAAQPATTVSSKYNFIPTTRILGVLEDEGWIPTSASQVHSHKEGNKQFAKHLIRLRRDEAIKPEVDKVIPEIVLFNSHNGRANYELRMGLYRFVCSNGMVVSDQEFGSIKIRHMGYTDEQVMEASQELIDNSTRIMNVVQEWQDVKLDRDQMRSFGREAAKLRFEDPDELTVNTVLAARRGEDMSSDLWTVFNRTQENLIQGGFLVSGGARRSRKIVSIDKNLDINTKLWDLAQNYSRN